MEVNTATISRRRFSSSQYDEYLKSHLAGDEPVLGEIKVIGVMCNMCRFELKWGFNFVLRLKSNVVAILPD